MGMGRGRNRAVSTSILVVIILGMGTQSAFGAITSPATIDSITVNDISIDLVCTDPNTNMGTTITGRVIDIDDGVPLGLPEITIISGIICDGSTPNNINTSSLTDFTIYNVRLTVITDDSGNSVDIDSFTHPDDEPPVITANTIADPFELTLTNQYTEGCTSTDNDPAYVGVCVTNSGAIDTSILGTQSITYSANADGAGNTPTNVVISTIVQDTTLPVITGNTIVDPIQLSLVNLYPEGCTSTDNDKSYVGICVTDSGGIDTSILDFQIITYRANADVSGNTPTNVNISTNVRDTILPTLSREQVETHNLIKGIDPLPTLTALVSDNDVSVNGNSIPCDTSAVNLNAFGNYLATCNFTDPSNNSAPQITYNVNVVSGEFPTITLIGANPITLQVGLDTYFEQGATCNDVEDGSIEVDIGGDVVDTSLVDTYTVTYDCADSSMNNAEQVQRTVILQDTTPPTISLNIEPPFDANVVLIKGFDIYVEVGATISDNDKFINGDPVSDINNFINENAIGVYIVTYNAVDPSGNVADQVIRIVSIVEGNPPVITILGDNPVTVPFGSVYVDEGATCIDEEDGDLTEIFYEETSENGDMVFNVGLEDDSDLIDTSILDPQTVTYTCTDASMNVILAVRDVEIQKSGGGGGASKHLTRPTFGVDHAMGTIQTVSNAISLNGFIINIDDNYYTEVPLQTLKVGQENKWSAKVYAERGLKFMSFLIGLPEIGMGNYAESEIIVEFNSDGTKKSVEVIQKDSIINKDSVRVNTWNTTCTPNDAVAKCKSVSVGFKLNQSPLNKVFANQAIDFKLRQQTTSFNEGFEVLGNSLNPAPVINVAQNGIIHDLTWIDPTFLDRTIAIDENGDLWQLQGIINSFWKKITQPEIIHCSDNNKAWEMRGCPEYNLLKKGQELLAMQYYPYLYSDIPFEEINNIFAYEYPDRDNNRLSNTQLE